MRMLNSNFVLRVPTLLRRNPIGSGMNTWRSHAEHGSEEETYGSFMEDRNNYFPWNVGVRFSINAVTASMRSSEIRLAAFFWAT